MQEGGATGSNAANVNGVFEPTGDVQNGKALFVKRGDASKWLRFNPVGCWLVSSAADTSIGWCQSVGPDKAHDDPTSVTKWQVYSGSDWEDQADVSCRPALLARAHLQAKRSPLGSTLTV